MWADPDLDEAAEVMRLVVEDRARGRAVGERAQQDVRRFHSPEARAPLVAARLAAARSSRADAEVMRELARRRTVLRRVARAGAGRVARVGRRVFD